MRKRSGSGIAFRFCDTRRADLQVASRPKVASGSENANVNINLSSPNSIPQYLAVNQWLLSSSTDLSLGLVIYKYH